MKNLWEMLNGHEADFFIKNLWEYELFGQRLYITTAHVCAVLVIIVIVAFALWAGRVIRRADIAGTPTAFQNVAELMVELLDQLVGSTTGKVSRRFANYIGTLFLFLFISNISGLVGLRPPTAYYGFTLPLGLISFVIIFYNKIKHQKVSGFLKGLCQPWPFWAPINIVGDLAVPISMSLRLFANILSGTVMLSLVYSLLPLFVKIGVPALLHIYFDLFSGAIQTYVFCMLTMTYVADATGT